jgi:hypothetical protein
MNRRILTNPQCDQRKPECLRCEKAKAPCPGFRDLASVLFRDESQRIIQKARNGAEQCFDTQEMQAVVENGIGKISNNSLPCVSKYQNATLPDAGDFAALVHAGIPSPISQSVNDLGANVFFSLYSYDNFPFPGEGRSWLMQAYFEDLRDSSFRTIVEAVGMALISNKFNAPQLASEAKEQYVRALAATKRALSSPTEFTSDCTLMTVILFGAYEVSKRLDNCSH